jgi:thiol-disulfide isomerase/thioredoxin
MRNLHVKSETEAKEINKLIQDGKKVFILVYMEGCGPCNATRPEWAKIEQSLKDQYRDNDMLVVIDVNKDFMDHIKHIGSVDGFPTIKYIFNDTIESYEGERTIDAFISWIESKINNVVSVSSATRAYKRIKGGSYKKRKRWSRKYKRSINCRRPRGFSQKQYCKYGRKK